MKNKYFIHLFFITSFNISYAEYAAKFFINGLSFKEQSNIVNQPSSNCIYEPMNNRFGAINISDNSNSYGVGLGESFIYYGSLLIGRDTATENFPSGLSLGDYVESISGYNLHEICADDFSMYPDINNPTPTYTYNEILIPNGSFGSANGSNGYPIFGFAQYNSTIHPTMPNIGTPISNGNGNRLMLEIYEYEPTFQSPMAVIYIVNGNEKINDSSNSGNIGAWWNQYDRIILSNSDESFIIEIPNNGGVNGNWARTRQNREQDTITLEYKNVGELITETNTLTSQTNTISAIGTLSNKVCLFDQSFNPKFFAWYGESSQYYFWTSEYSTVPSLWVDVTTGKTVDLSEFGAPATVIPGLTKISSTEFRYNDGSKIWKITRGPYVYTDSGQAYYKVCFE